MNNKKNILKTLVAFLLISTLGTGLILPIATSAIEITGDEGFNEPFDTGGSGGGTAGSAIGSLLGSKCASLGSILGGCVPIVRLESVPNTIESRYIDIAKGIARMLVQTLTQQIVNLIRTGGQGGGPLFVQDWNQFLLDAADQASGVFIKELGLTQLCEPFAPSLRLIFAGGRQSLQERYRCTVSTVMGNIQGFFDDFNNGGWQRWIELTQVQNNPYGQYLGLLEEKEKREAQASFNEAMSANGFLGKKDCSYPQIEHGMGDQPVGNRCLIVSPGTYLENRLAEATTDDIRQLNLAQSFDQIALASFQTLIQTLFFSPGGLSSSNINSTTFINQTQNSLNNLQQSAIQITGINEAISVTQSIIATKENSLAKTKDEIQTLGLLKSCLQNKSLPVNTVDADIASASSTAQTIEGDILNQTVLLETLKDDEFEMLNVPTVNELNAAVSKTNADILKVGSLTGAIDQNNKIAADKAKAEDDLQSCLNPPPPTSGE